MNGQFERSGYAVVEGVLTPAQCDAAAAAISPLAVAAGGTRALLAEPWCRQLCAQLARNVRLAELTGPDRVAVQCTFFEKSAGRNWLVPMHQDLSIPVAQRVDHPQLSGWSKKEGSWFVHAPPEVLAQLVAVRVHLDPCGAEDGPLRVVPGSHLDGPLSAEAASAARAMAGEAVCVAGKGAALVMRPLLLHASSRGQGTSRRRVLHFVLGPRTLPFGLAWEVALPFTSVETDPRNCG